MLVFASHPCCPDRRDKSQQRGSCCEKAGDDGLFARLIGSFAHFLFGGLLHALRPSEGFIYSTLGIRLREPGLTRNELGKIVSVVRGK